MKHVGHTLLELIFIVVIIGILTGMAYYSFKPNYVRDDAAKVLMQIEVARYKGVGYDKAINTLGNYDASNGCIDLANLDNNTTGLDKADNYKFHSNIAIKPANLRILCFDKFGRTFDGNLDNNATDIEQSLLLKDINITLSYGKTPPISILIDHKTGIARLSTQ